MMKSGMISSYRFFILQKARDMIYCKKGSDITERSDEKYMQEAIRLALEAGESGEIPVGAVVVKNGEIIGRGKNHREKNGTALGHAEIAAIEEACRTVGDWRLCDSELYVTLEPCPMCAGAILNSRIKRVVYGASDEKTGCLGGHINLFEMGFEVRPAVTAGIMKDECEEIIKGFFKGKR